MRALMRGNLPLSQRDPWGRLKPSFEMSRAPNSRLWNTVSLWEESRRSGSIGATLDTSNNPGSGSWLVPVQGLQLRTRDIFRLLSRSNQVDDHSPAFSRAQGGSLRYTPETYKSEGAKKNW